MLQYSSEQLLNEPNHIASVLFVYLFIFIASPEISENYMAPVRETFAFQIALVLKNKRVRHYCSKAFMTSWNCYAFD